MVVLKEYLDIIGYFGYRNQMKKLNEECYEFLEAVDNYEDCMMILNSDERSGDMVLARDFVIEEMADMLILLTQFIAKYNINASEIDRHIDVKLERTLERIGNGYYKKDDGN